MKRAKPKSPEEIALLCLRRAFPGETWIILGDASDFVKSLNRAGYEIVRRRK